LTDITKIHFVKDRQVIDEIKPSELGTKLKEFGFM